MMEYFDLYYATETDATEESSSSEHSIDDIYEMLDSIDGRLSELQLERSRSGTRSVSETSESGTGMDSESVASLTDAVEVIKDNTFNTYSWLVILAFVIVIFECKKMIRGAIKSWYERE